VGSQSRNGGILAWKAATAALGVVAVFAAASAPRAQESASKPKPLFIAPLPPPRPTDLAEPHAAPIAAPSAPSLSEPPAAASSVIDAPPHPLPAASRERMHACGLEWRGMKASGAATDKTWREFAQICLAR
jgi:hypothetical protein